MAVVRIDYKIDDDQIQAASKSLDELDESTEAATESSKELEDQSKDTNKTAATSSKVFSSLGDQLKNVANNFTIAGKGAGDLTAGLFKTSKAALGTSKSFRVLKLALAATGIGLIVVALGSLVTFLTKTTEGTKQLAIAAKALEGVFNVLIGTVSGLVKGLGQIFSGEFRKGLVTVGETITTIDDRIADVVESSEKLVVLERQFREANIAAIETVQALEDQRDQLALLAEDATTSFAAQRKAQEDLQKVERDLANERVAQAKRARDLLQKNLEAAERQGAQRTLDEKEQLAQLNAAVAASLAERERLTLEADQRRRQLRSDELERDLDILIDGLDNQKSINERIIADETIAFADRQKLQDDTEKLALDSFDRQISTIQKTTDARIDASKLLAEQDAIALLEQIRALGLTEIFEGRLLEVIRDRRTAQQDLNETQKDLDDESAERQENELDRAEERANKIDALNKRLAENEIQNQKDIENSRRATLQSDLELTTQVIGSVGNLLSAFGSQSKELALFNITLSSAEAIGNAVALALKAPSPLAAIPILFGLIGTITANINSAKRIVQGAEPPQFAEGVIDLNGPGTGTSDSIWARLSNGESVMTALETNDFKPTLSAIRNGDVDPDVINGVAQGQIPVVPSPTVMEVQRDSFTFDENGFTQHLRRRNTRIDKKQKRYSFAI